MMTPQDDTIHGIAARFGPHTDGPEHVEPVLYRFLQAMRRAPTAEGALEIGVRGGGMSAALCELGGRIMGPPFVVLSVDPYGRHPYPEGGRDVADFLDYDERHYGPARALLSNFGNNMFYRLDADTFLLHLLPHLCWWREGQRYPKRRPWLGFGWLDGPHDNRNVAFEAMLLWNYLLPGAELCIDNADRCPEAIDFLSVSLERCAAVERFPPARVAFIRG